MGQPGPSPGGQPAEWEECYLMGTALTEEWFGGILKPKVWEKLRGVCFDLKVLSPYFSQRSEIKNQNKLG